MSLNLLEKLQLGDEKNLLIQGLPSSIEKQFMKLSFAKNVTPLLRARKIDFALLFAVNQNQLNGILQDVLPALNDSAKLWVAFPKATSKIMCDMHRDCCWQDLLNRGYEIADQVNLDHVWTANFFRKTEEMPVQGSLVKKTRAARASAVV